MTEVDEIKTAVDDKFGEIKGKVVDAGRRMKLRQRIVDNPWGLVAFGALAGVWVASHGRGNKRRGAVVGAFGAITLRFMRDAAMYEMTKIVRGWFVEPAKPTPFAR